MLGFPNRVENTEEQVQREMRVMLQDVTEQRQQRARDEKARDKSYDQIPAFFTKKKRPSKTHKLLKEATKLKFIAHKEKEWLMDDKDKKNFWALIVKHQTGPRQTGVHKLDYADFCKVKTGMKNNRHLTPEVFLKFPTDSSQRISGDALYSYVCKRIRAIRFRLALMPYDKQDTGSLTEHELSCFINAQIPHMDQLADLDKNFQKFYVITVVRKFFFPS